MLSDQTRKLHKELKLAFEKLFDGHLYHFAEDEKGHDESGGSPPHRGFCG